MPDVFYVTIGALAGFFVGLTGVGGGAFLTPMLLLFSGIAPATAIATDLWFAAITKLVGGVIHHDGGEVDWQVVCRLWMGSLPVSVLVVFWVTVAGSVAKVTWLTQAIGAVVLITAIGLISAPRLAVIARGRRLDNPVKFKSVQPLMTVASGAILGLCVALTSVGAGALGSVMLLYLYPLRMTPHRLVATDLVHAIPLAVVAGTGYLFSGLVDWQMLSSLLIGSVPAVIFGSLLARFASGRWIQTLMAIVLLFAGWKILASA